MAASNREMFSLFLRRKSCASIIYQSYSSARSTDVSTWRSSAELLRIGVDPGGKVDERLKRAGEISIFPIDQVQLIGLITVCDSIACHVRCRLNLMVNDEGAAQPLSGHSQGHAVAAGLIGDSGLKILLFKEPVGTPYSFSAFKICWLRDGWVIYSLSAALEKLLSSATADT